MSDQTKIEWCDATWNPVTGCSPMSEGCDNCYAARMARRLKAMGVPSYEHGFEVRWHTDRLGVPMRWKRPRRIFLCSMGDLFHEKVPTPFIKSVVDIMRVCPQHTFQVLTKRPQRMRHFARKVPLPPNFWAGVTVETAWNRQRIDLLLTTPAYVRFLSCEPLLSPLGPIPGLHGLDWIIAGCESGPGARPTDPDWFRDIRDQCVEADVPFFLKQMVVDDSHVKLPELDGRIWNQFPRRDDDSGGGIHRLSAEW